jgi:DNA-damage-inducible protein J
MQYVYNCSVINTQNMTVGIQIRVDKELKKQAEAVFADIGLDMPSAIRVFLKKVVVTRSIPFKLEGDDSWVTNFTEEEMDELNKIHKDVLEGKNLSPRFKTTKEAIKYLKDSCK